MIQHLGEYLKRERLKKGLSIQEVSDSTKIRKNILQAIEAADFTDLGTEVYVKGYLKSYARMLGLDQEKVLAMYRRELSKEQKSVSAEVRRQKQKPRRSNSLLSKVQLTPKVLGLGVLSILVVLFLIYALTQVQALFTAPALQIFEPLQIAADFDGEIYVAGNSFRIEGSTDPQTVVTFNSQVLNLEAGNQFSTSEIPLTSNTTTVILTATNQFGLTSSIKMQVRRGGNSVAADTQISAEIEIVDEVTPLLIRKDGKIEFNDRAFPGDLITVNADNILQIESDAPYNLKVTINGQEYSFTERKKTWENIDGNIIEK